MNILTNLLNSKSSWTLGSAALCGIAATEMGVRTIIDLSKIIRNRNGRQGDRDLNDFSADLGGLIFYGLLASNVVPGFARAGGIVFVGYSFYTDTSERDAYWSSKAISLPFEKTWEGLCFIGRNLNIVEHPTWAGVAVLITVVGIYSLTKHPALNRPQQPTPPNHPNYNQPPHSYSNQPPRMQQPAPTPRQPALPPYQPTTPPPTQFDMRQFA